MPKAADVPGLLARTALFGTVPEADRVLVARQMRMVRYPAGTLIFARGDPGADVYLVVSGRVRLSVYSGEGRELAFLNAGPGEIFGEIAALDGGTRTADARTLGEVTAMALARTALNRLIETVPSIASATIAFLCARLRATNDIFEAVALHTLEVRLARFLLSAIRLRGGAPGRGRVAIELGMSQGEIALLVGASRPKVNLALQALEMEGAITREGSQITCDLDALARLAGKDEE